MRVPSVDHVEIGDYPWDFYLCSWRTVIATGLPDPNTVKKQTRWGRIQLQETVHRNVSGCMTEYQSKNLPISTRNLASPTFIRSA